MIIALIQSRQSEEVFGLPDTFISYKDLETKIIYQISLLLDPSEIEETVSAYSGNIESIFILALKFHLGNITSWIAEISVLNEKKSLLCCLAGEYEEKRKILKVVRKFSTSHSISEKPPVEIGWKKDFIRAKYWYNRCFNYAPALNNCAVLLWNSSFKTFPKIITTEVFEIGRLCYDLLNSAREILKNSAAEFPAVSLNISLLSRIIGTKLGRDPFSRQLSRISFAENISEDLIINSSKKLEFGENPNSNSSPDNVIGNSGESINLESGIKKVEVDQNFKLNSDFHMPDCDEVMRDSDSSGMFILGYLSFTGAIGGVNLRKARVWFERAAKLSHPWACYYLSLIYCNGLEVLVLHFYCNY